MLADFSLAKEVNHASTCGPMLYTIFKVTSKLMQFSKLSLIHDSNPFSKFALRPRGRCCGPVEFSPRPLV